MVVIESKLGKDSSKLILLFGVGLIGESILQEFDKQFSCTFHQFPFSWGKEDAQIEELNQIKEFIFARGKGVAIQLIWSAGKGGFFSTDSDFQIEFADFERVLNWLQQALIPQNSCSFHLFSSAGGLFEGQVLVNEQSKPKPMRPYGHWKLKQEDLLNRSEGLVNRIIYRPSTVYGYSPKARIGLIAKLLICANKNQFIEIFASKTALRDYIYVGDIAKFVVAKIENSDLSSLKLGTTQINWLISGKSSNILEICTKVSELINKPVLNSFRLVLDNSLDNTFNAKLKPKELAISPIEMGLRKIFQTLK
ncbi:SDR family oxidoreductase [Sandaracinomonas limnophila]|uniref:SDR family oxidoreductase n=1 Tax=Sandaracinomonas limnophila TaxID=1862386 RepID=A0A437PUQ4_9BACT|nr:SDR family oxidoreductase [Sandaracinomonas limnophila]RVU25982.1 SDR family oxidoreductase [Sandaracinomonas limnophila]